MGISVFNGTSWAEINDLKGYKDGQWQGMALKRYDGNDWEQLWPCHSVHTTDYALNSYVVTKSRSNPSQVSTTSIITGTRNGASELYDAFLFFPMEQIRADVTGAEIQKVTLQLKRKEHTSNDGENTAYVTVASALTGIDPNKTNNTWSRSYTLLAETGFGFGAKKKINLPVSCLNDLMNGTADCLCLPTPSKYIYNSNGYGRYEPTETILTVTYYI